MQRKFRFNVSLLSKLKSYKIETDKNFYIYSVCTIKSPKNNSLMFINSITEDIIDVINSLNECVILISKESEKIVSNSNLLLYVEEPRKEYAKLLKFILDNDVVENSLRYEQGGYIIGKNVIIGKNAKIEPFVFIDHDVVIGQNCVIKSGVKINKYCIIGDNCIIRENSVIGGEGFGIERDTDGVNYKIPHLGGVKVGNNVEIGALSSIVSGTIEPTIIEDYVKIDDCVFVAHNCHIGKGTFLIANAEISGSVYIGESAWIGPNAAIIQKVNVGSNAIVGIGAVVTKDVNKYEVVAGNPADSISNLKKFRSFYKTILKSEGSK